MPYLVTAQSRALAGPETRIHLSSETITEVVVEFCTSSGYAVMVQHVPYDHFLSRTNDEKLRAKTILQLSKGLLYEKFREEFGTDDGRRWLQEKLAEEASRKEFGT